MLKALLDPAISKKRRLYVLGVCVEEAMPWKVNAGRERQGEEKHESHPAYVQPLIIRLNIPTYPNIPTVSASFFPTSLSCLCCLFYCSTSVLCLSLPLCVFTLSSLPFFLLWKNILQPTISCAWLESCWAYQEVFWITHGWSFPKASIWC